jgi:uncharacterized protein YdcH (DUF465 family)
MTDIHDKAMAAFFAAVEDHQKLDAAIDRVVAVAVAASHAEVERLTAENARLAKVGSDGWDELTIAEAEKERMEVALNKATAYLGQHLMALDIRGFWRCDYCSERFNSEGVVNHDPNCIVNVAAL